MRIAYFVTGHGFGHGVRTAAICNHFSPDVRVTLLSSLPQEFFTRELLRPFDYREAEFDCGCVQRDGITVDVPATLNAYMGIAPRNAEALDGLVSWCKRERIDGIVSDITPFAFEVAAAARVPSVGVSNFSWLDIYEEYVAVVPDFRPYLEHIRRQYGLATELLALSPANRMSPFSHRRSIGPVGRVGRDRSDEIKLSYGIAPDKRIGLIYTGVHGLDDVRWESLDKFSAKWEFVGIHRIPRAPANFHFVQKQDFRYQDLTASADLMISKIGYGVYAECLLNATPLLYVPREDFAEFRVLEQGVKDWGFGHHLDQTNFRSLNWDAILDLVEKASRPQVLADVGAQECASAIESIMLH